MNIKLLCLSLWTLLLSGCLATINPQSREDISNNISVTTGTSYCPECTNLKTYITPTIISGGARVGPDSSAEGWINLNAKLQSTNRTEGNVPEYQLLVSLTNNGYFINETDFWFMEEDGSHTPIKSILSGAGNGNPKQNYRCFHNFGSGCRWDQTLAIPPSRIEEALKTNQGIRIFAGREFYQATRSSDGYRPTISRTKDYAGIQVTIPAASIAGFIDGIAANGGEVPSDIGILRREQAKALTQALTQQKENARKAIELPLKMKVGTQLCLQEKNVVFVGFVEGIANDRIQIRVSNAHMLGNQRVRPAGFKQYIIWDSPARWDVC